MSQHSTFHSFKSEIKSNLSLSTPLIASQLIYASSGFIGTALIAKLGEDALAASVLVSMTWISLSVLFFGLLNSVSVLVSHQYGARNYKAISEIMGQSFFLGVIIIILIIALLASMPFYLHFTPQPPAVIKLAIEYVHGLLWMIPGLIVLVICEQFLAGVNLAKLVLRISLLVVPVEVPLIYVLIFGKFGFPACGIAGIGYGFGITYTFTAILLIIYLFKSQKFEIFGIFNEILTINLKRFKELIRVGLPMGCMHVIEVSTFTFATFWIAQFGTTMLAAHQIVMQYLSFVITIVFAMSQAITIRVGHAIGREDFSNIRLIIFTGMILNSCLITLIAIAFNFMPDFFLKFDININDPANFLLIRDGSLLLAIAGVLILFDNLRIIGFGALRGLKDTTFPMYASFISFWIIGLSCSYLLGFNFHLQGKGIWWGLTFGIVCGAIIVYLRLELLLKRMGNSSKDSTTIVNNPVSIFIHESNDILK